MDRSLDRRRALVGLALAVGLAAAGVGGCTWESMVPKGRPIALPENAPTEIVTLGLCQPQKAVLDCGGEHGRDHECNHWYRVDVMQAGVMHIQLLLSDIESQGALTRLLVRPLGEAVLAQKVSTYGEPLEIDVAVSPDVYGVLVQGGEGHRKYQLLASMSPPGSSEGLSCPGLPESVPELGPDDDGGGEDSD